MFFSTAGVDYTKCRRLNAVAEFLLGDTKRVFVPKMAWASPHCSDHNESVMRAT